jgi:hypothetical protein
LSQPQLEVENESICICSTADLEAAAAAANAPALTAQQIVAVLRSMDANGAEKLHWQTSIADLMIESWQ